MEVPVEVVVIGGGIAGLAAAWDLGVDHEVTLLEASDRVGGKLRLSSVAGVTVDVGAEAMLARRPEGLALASEAGLATVSPTAATSRVWTRGVLRRLPRTLMGVPLDLADLEASGVLSQAGLERVRAEAGLGPATLSGDVSVGDFLGERFGDELVERLVEPLLGGVYAGSARAISLRAAVPQVAALAARGSLLAGVAGLPATPEVPVFAGLAGGMGSLPAALADRGRFEVRTGVTVHAVRRTASGFAVSTGPATSPEVLTAERVVLAVPPAAAARLLGDVAPAAARELAAVETASTAVVTLAFREADVRHLPDLGGGTSGLLVPPVEGRAIKAATFSHAKWDWVRAAGSAEGVIVLRTSLGRHREEATLQATDAALVATSLADLAAAVGPLPEPVDAHVQRWGGGLPQYAVGHLDRVARIRAAVAEVPGLAVCGAAYDGVGIPAVIGSARRAVAELRAAE